MSNTTNSTDLLDVRDLLEQGGAELEQIDIDDASKEAVKAVQRAMNEAKKSGNAEGYQRIAARLSGGVGPNTSASITPQEALQIVISSDQVSPALGEVLEGLLFGNGAKREELVAIKNILVKTGNADYTEVERDGRLKAISTLTAEKAELETKVSELKNAAQSGTALTDEHKEALTKTRETVNELQKTFDGHNRALLGDDFKKANTLVGTLVAQKSKLPA